MQGLRDSVQVQGVGWIEWTTRDVFNRISVVRTRAHFTPEARMRLLSAQTHFNEHDDGSPRQDKSKVTLQTANGTELTFPYDRNCNLP